MTLETSALWERIGRRAARIEILEWLQHQPLTIHTERVLRFVREAEAADPSPEKGKA